MKSRRKEGHPLAETADMKQWRQEFEKISLEEHIERLKKMGLDEDDIEEFKEEFAAKKKAKE